MLLSTVLILAPSRKTVLPPTLGNAVHACFLDLIRRIDPGLAERLHSPGREKPFTTSPLKGPFERNGGSGFVVTPGREYWLRFTSLDPALSRVLGQLDPDAIGRLALFEGEFTVLKVYTQAEEHPWARRVTYEDLYTAWVTTKRSPPSKLRLRFCSPTTFRAGRYVLPFPLPRLVFLTLGAKWNRYAPVHLGEEIAKVIDERITLSRYDLRTRILDFGSYKQVGFVGECEFQLRVQQADELWARVVHLLADFAFFAGVGYRTPMGMGQVAVTDREYGCR